MKAKTEEAILRRRERLPLHHIDTSVLIEAQKDTKLGDACADYLNRVGYKYRGVVSSSVLGEFLLVTLRDMPKPEDRELAIKILEDFIQKRSIVYATPAMKAYHIAVRIAELDPRVENADALHYAVAVQENASTFVTLDTALIGHKTLEKEFGVRVTHPSDL